MALPRSLLLRIVSMVFSLLGVVVRDWLLSYGTRCRRQAAWFCAGPRLDEESMREGDINEKRKECGPTIEFFDDAQRQALAAMHFYAISCRLMRWRMRGTVVYTMIYTMVSPPIFGAPHQK